jgi:hypothetical protein
VSIWMRLHKACRSLMSVPAGAVASGLANSEYDAGGSIISAKNESAASVSFSVANCRRAQCKAQCRLRRKEELQEERPVYPLCRDDGGVQSTRLRQKPHAFVLHTLARHTPVTQSRTGAAHCRV